MFKGRKTVLVTGGRDYRNRDAVFADLDTCAPGFVVQGGCKTGADRWAREWCDKNGIPCATIHAAWTAFNLAAGPIRNGWMAELFGDEIDVALVYPGGKGTGDMKKRLQYLACEVKEAK